LISTAKSVEADGGGWRLFRFAHLPDRIAARYPHRQADSSNRSFNQEVQDENDIRAIALG